jgi:transcriptional antiterminator RfaH
MPILRAETSVFPENLLQDLPPGDARQWWVLYTKARQEKSISRDLLALQIPFYLPLVKKTARTRGRTVHSFVPLFSGYVFLFGSEQERVRSLTTNRVSRVISVADSQRLVFDLRQLHQLIAADAPLTVEARLEPGDRVRVRQGPLLGLEGTVLVRRNRTRLLIAVDFLQQGASVEIDDFLLEPLN